MIDDSLYVFGGATSISGGWFGDSTDTTMIYDITTGDTTYGAPLPYSIVTPGCVMASNGSILLVGGWSYDTGSYLDFIQIYDPEANSWSVTANPAPVPLGLGAVTMGMDGFVYIFGGGWSFNTTIIYDPSDDSWSYGTDIPYMGWGGAAVPYSTTEIFLIGGANISAGDVTNEVAVYDPTTETWRFVSSMNTPRGFGNAVLARNGYIYCLGGGDGAWFPPSYFNSDVERYDVAADEWESADVWVSGQAYCAGQAVDDHGRLFLAGGYSGSAEPTVQMFTLSEVTGLNELVISSPTDGSIVSGVVAVQADFKNFDWSFWLMTVDLLVDGVLVESQTGNLPIEFMWDTTGLIDGSTHTLTVRVYGSDTTVAEDSVTVTVSAQSPEEKLAALQQQLADVQMQLYMMALAMQEANESTMAYLEDKIAELQLALTAIGNGLALMGAGQTAAMADLNETLVDLQAQLDDFQEQIDRIENKADTAGTYGIVTMVLVIIIVVLVALTVMMARKKP